jgi:small-conductance mechanosensitive channel
VRPGAELSAVADTRLRLLRRLIFVAIVVIGIALGLMQFAAVKRAAAGVLASSAVLGLIVGFAARQTLANCIAGILLAATQPIRIGDLVQFEGQAGVVEDIRLTYTYLRAEDNRRIIVPNERLASSTIENFTIMDPRVEVEVQIGLPLEADPARALEALGELGHVEVSAVEKDGYQILVRTHAEHPLDRREVAARIRAACVERLRRENILG